MTLPTDARAESRETRRRAPAGETLRLRAPLAPVRAAKAAHTWTETTVSNLEPARPKEASKEEASRDTAAAATGR